MQTMDQIHHIRNQYFEKGETITKIAQDLKLDRKTVHKYINKEDFNTPISKPRTNKQLCPKLEPFKSVIDTWLLEDKTSRKKQRHTAKRVYRRLCKEYTEFACSYRTVATYYKVKHAEIFQGAKNGYLPLVHQPGEAQVDFGSADFIENGKRHSGKYLTVAFPQSNQGYLQLKYGENIECLLEGLVAIFQHIGSVPHELWFDNASAIVTKCIRGGGRELTQRFKRFQEHHQFKAVFMNPRKGNEKGSVENKVGYLRRNLLVPVPRFLSLEIFNQNLLKACDADAKREHYRYDQTIEERFQTDIAHGIPLPRIPFELRGQQTVKTNKWGKFFLNKGLHEYPVSPKYSETNISILLSSSHIEVQDENHRTIVVHRRLYGDEKQQSMEWIPYLKQLSRRPRALKYSGIYEIMPNDLQAYLNQCQNSEVGKVLKILAELTRRTGFDSAMNTVQEALCHGAVDTDSLQSLYRRLYADIPELPPLQDKNTIPTLLSFPIQLQHYDVFLQKGEKRDA